MKFYFFPFDFFNFSLAFPLLPVEIFCSWRVFFVSTDFEKSLLVCLFHIRSLLAKIKITFIF